ncbi:MAG: hypothetical protein KQH63_13390 [Desulfobulbaceae bacterium]|nr:hypothetical protein [Desulfobulbaceae bacterium]
MNDTLFKEFYYLRDQLTAQQVYIKKLEMLLENKESSCREALDQLKKEYISLIGFDDKDAKEALGEGRF